MNSKTRLFPDRPRVELRDFLGKSLKPDRDGLIFDLLDFRPGKKGCSLGTAVEFYRLA